MLILNKSFILHKSIIIRYYGRAETQSIDKTDICIW